jgi:hypothetical protein
MTTSTAPAPGAIRLPRSKFLAPIIESLDGYTDALDDAETIDDYLRNLRPIPPVPAGVALGPLEEWQLAEDERDAAVEKLERHRNRALVRRCGAIAESSSILRANCDHILRLLNLHLLEVIAKCAPDAEVLIAAGVETADDAIKRDLVAEWQRLQQETWPDYRRLRDDQEAVMLHLAPDRIWRSARPSIDGEPPATTLWFRNLPQLWPDWRERGRTRPQVTLMGPPPRPEPWPKPDGAEFLLWSFRVGAEHWIPDTKQYDEEFGPRRQQVADNAELAARRAQFDELAAQSESDDEPYRSMMIGQPNSFRGMPPPILGEDPVAAAHADEPPAELAQLTNQGADT